MNYPNNEYPHSKLTGQIIQAAHRVHSDVGCGLKEKIYENGLCVDFGHMGIHFSQQQRYNVFYMDKLLGDLVPDLVVDDKVIVDAKVVEEFNKEHIAQMLSYLNVSKLQVGLLINFKHSSVKVKRITNIKP